MRAIERRLNKLEEISRNDVGNEVDSPRKDGNEPRRHAGRLRHPVRIP
jgi:hypothetical protein